MNKSLVFALGILVGSGIGTLTSLYVFSQAEAEWETQLDKFHKDYTILYDKYKALENSWREGRPPPIDLAEPPLMRLVPRINTEEIIWVLPNLGLQPRTLKALPIRPSHYIYKTYDDPPERIPDPKPASKE